MRYFVYPGPSAERDFDRIQPGDIWEFKKTVAGEQLYIKKMMTGRRPRPLFGWRLFFAPFLRSPIRFHLF